MAPETIDPRVGEELPVERLSDFLRGKLEGSDGKLIVRQFGGGHANLTYLLEYPDAQYVLRRPPLGPVAPGAHDMAREFKVLEVLHQAYPPAPRGFLFCDDESVLGAPFFVMERRRGIVVRKKMPEEFGGGKDETANRVISEAMIDALADFHAVDYESIGLGDLGKPAGFMERQVRGWTDRWYKSATEEVADAKTVSDWLAANLPDESEGTLVHNDWRLDNMMLAEDDYSKVVGVFDWDMCTLGDPLADVGGVLSLWFEVGEPLGMMAGAMPSNTAGFLTRRQAVERYAKRTGRDAGTMHYYYVFGLFRIAGVVQQIYYRFHKGQTKDQRFSAFNVAANMILALAKEKIDSGEF